MLAGLFTEIQQDLDHVREMMVQELKSDQSFLDQLISYLLQRRGKMIRPALVILSGRLCQGGSIEDLIALGAGTEMLHMATLIHDDIIDEASERRGLQTVNKRFSSRLAVLLGDYFYSKSLKKFAFLKDQGFELVSDIVANLVQGELIQYANTFKKDQEWYEYWQLIDHKTAFFIASCCELGGIVGKGTEEQVQALRIYGQNLGRAFQICDDLLDFSADPEKLGKSINQDVANGIYTLPILHALKTSNRQEELRHLLEKDQLSNRGFQQLTHLLKQTGSLRYAYQEAVRLCQDARSQLHIFPTGYERKALESLAQFNLKREF